jgi:hypothetical protein
VNAGAASEARLVTLGWLSTVAFQKGAVRELTSQCPLLAQADIAAVLNDVRFLGQSGHGEFISGSNP